MKLENIIVVYDYAYINGGAAKVAVKSAVALSNRDFHVVYFSAVGPICKELQNSRVYVYCTNQKDINTAGRLSAVVNGIWNSQARKEFSKVLNQYNPENTVIHFHGWSKALSVAVISVAQKAGFKTFITMHDYFSICPNGGLYDYKEGKICHRIPMSKDCVLCNCDKRSYPQKIWRTLRQSIQDLFVKKNRKVVFITISDLNERIIRSCVSSKKMYRVDNTSDLMEIKQGNHSYSNMFLFVGRLSEEKGIEVFCQAIERLRKEEERVRGCVVGDGQLTEHLKSQYPMVEFVGWKNKNEVWEYMSEARALVFPSKWYEGAPLTIVEALSAGLPCVVSDCTSAIELIDDGVNGAVFNTDNFEDLYVKLHELLDNGLIEEYQKNINNTFIESKYSDEAHANKLIKVYNTELDGNS